MSEQEPPDGASSGGADALPPATPSTGERLTAGGYAYSIEDAAAEAAAAPLVREKKPSEPLRIGRPALAALVLVPAIAVGAIAWFAASALSGGGGGGDRAEANVASVINAFSQGQGSDAMRRYEGELPPGLPEDLPSYPGARVVSSLVQITGEDAVFLIVYDTGASRDDVASELTQRFSDDPWQIDQGQENRDGTLRQFSRIDDADVSGIFLVADSTGGDVTTIFVSVQAVSGAADADISAFEPVASKALPEGFPSELPHYPDAIVIETMFQKGADANTFVASYIAQANTSKVLDRYRSELEDAGWTVGDGPAPEDGSDGQTLTFEDESGDVTGNVIAATFAEDEDYTRIDVQVRDAR